VKGSLAQIAALERKGLVVKVGGPRPSGSPFLAVLPYPPTVNHYWKHSVRQGRIHVRIGKKGEAYIGAVAAFAPPSLLLGPLALEAVVCPPDRIRRDLDNVLKALLDAMAKAGVYGDDTQVRKIAIRWGPLIEDGCVYVRVRPMTAAELAEPVPEALPWSEPL
jgi:crossover junction endodeoxyribonuclease RusA